MNKKLKRNIAVGLFIASIATLNPIEQPKVVEAGWLSDAIGSVIGAATGDKAVRRNSAKQIDKILHQAVKNNDYDMAVKAIEQGANVNSMYEDKFPLVYALNYIGYPKYDTRMADLLISKGADIEGWYDGKSKHYYAFLFSEPKVIQYLLDKGLNVNIKGNNNVSLLMQTVIISTIYEKERHDLIQNIVNKGADLNVRSLDYGCGGALNISRYVYRGGDTALHAAAYLYDMESAKILLYAGANKNIKNKEGKTPLDIAIDRGATEMIKLLMDWQ